MNIAYFNGKFLPKEEIKINPDDRGFLFADGIYEVVRWYKGFFYDMNGHVARLKRSLGELSIKWLEADMFNTIAYDLIKQNKLEESDAMVYLQVTRGVAKRNHVFPSPETAPTAYAYSWGFKPDLLSKENGIKVMLKEEIRWSRCDIKSIALLPNTLSFQEAYTKGMQECIFVRDGAITEGSHSNIFFITQGTLYTHPESNYILSGITRKNIIRIALETGIEVREEALQENRIRSCSEAFIANTSSEVTPVLEIGGITLGEGVPGPVTSLLREKFDAEIRSLLSRNSNIR